jgi:hypothetical protein
MKTLTSVSLATALTFGFMSHSLLATPPHVHGAGALQLVLEGGNLSIELRLPAMDVVGFEHAPREAKHQEAVKKAVALLKDSRKAFELPAAAQCAVAPGKVESALLETRQDHDHGHDKPDHDHHEHSDEEAHADFEVAYRFDCRRPESLKSIKVTLFQYLPRLEKLEVQSVTPTGQKSQQLVPGQDTIQLD